MKGVTIRAYVSRLVQTEISIHTPVKGVTPFAKAGDRQDRISIHTPVKGVTDRGVGRLVRDLRFQSTHP